MKSRGIIFAGRMIREILENRKRQTRRVVRLNMAGRVEYQGKQWHHQDPHAVRGCPYGQVGDHLWVRETWKVGAWRDDGRMAIDYLATPEITNTPWVYPPFAVFNDLCRQSLQDCADKGAQWVPSNDRELPPTLVGDWGRYIWDAGKSPCRIRPSIFMPKWASRITLEITRVRIERLHDISEHDAVMEGALNDQTANDYMRHEYMGGPARVSFKLLWESINGAKHPWAGNPLVWVIGFKPCEKGDK